MQIRDVLADARESMSVRRVFGDPIERDGLTIIPVANVMGGGGAGSGEGPMTEGRRDVDAGAGGSELTGGDVAPSSMGSGSGVGFGLRATPAGVYVIKDGDVQWQPAMDLTRIAIMGQIVAIVFLLVVRSVLRSRTSR